MNSVRVLSGLVGIALSPSFFGTDVAAQERRVLDLKIGVGAYVPLGGKEFQSTGDQYDFDRPTYGFEGALRFHTHETRSLGLVVQWAQFGFVDQWWDRQDLRGARRYVTVGLDLRRTWTALNTNGVRPFVGLGIGVAFERFTDAMFCKNSDGTPRIPCREEPHRNTGGWAAFAMGAELPVSHRIRIESALSLDYVAMGSGGTGFSIDDEGVWADLSVGMVATLW